VDYRHDARTGISRLSLLGPLFSSESDREEQRTALRPLLHTTSSVRGDGSFSHLLYPLASAETTPEVSRFQLLQLLQRSVFRKDEPEQAERQFMLFPFIVSGDSKQHGPYLSLFPLYGDIYGRFYRDEYHFALFPLYARTVNKGATTYSLPYPFLSWTTGERESGFQIWPLFGTAAKEGAYRSRFALWPLYQQEERGLGSDNPVSSLILFPLYGGTDSPRGYSRTWLWPLFGHAVDHEHHEETWDLLWPLWQTVRGDRRQVNRFLPLYAAEQSSDASKTWYLWPLFRSDTLKSPLYRQEQLRLLYFLFTDKRESWAVDDRERRRTALWPLFLYRREPDGSASLSLPAPVEPVLDKDGIEKAWAPLWRLYDQSWSPRGSSSLSILWRLFWHEQDQGRRAWELFPLVRYREEQALRDMQFLKGLVHYRDTGSHRNLNHFWLPFGFSWQSGPTAGVQSGS
jgi:hypothetical protein